MTPSEAKEPLVSIVTPVLNRVSRIENCLASVASQTYPNIEHIVVDGGSTDGTLDVITRFAERSPLRWISEKDEGMYDAINKGMAMGRGQILAYLNSDDLYMPWSVATAVAELQKGPDLVFGDLGIIRVLDDLATWFSIQFYRPFDLRFYTHIASLGQPTLFWNRRVKDAIGAFSSDYKLIGDCEYWLRAATNGHTFSHVDEILAVQIDHDETLRITQRKRLDEEFKRMRSDYAAFAPPPRFPKMHRRMKGLRWRLDQWRFLLEYRKDTPQAWPRFIDFLKRYDIRVNRLGSLLLYSLPGRIRPRSARWVDTSGFTDKILQEISSDVALKEER